MNTHPKPYTDARIITDSLRICHAFRDQDATVKVKYNGTCKDGTRIYHVAVPIDTPAQAENLALKQIYEDNPGIAVNILKAI